MKRLIVMLLTGALLAALPGCAADQPPRTASSPVPMPAVQNLGSLARYAQNLQSVYAHGVDVSGAMDEAEVVIELYVDGEMPEPEMRRWIADARSRARYGIDEYRTWLYTLPPRPRFADRNQEASLRAFEEMVRGLTELLEAKLRLLGRLFEAAVAGNERAYALAGADSLALSGALIDAENTAAEAALLATPEGHPQRGVHQASVGSNLAARAALLLLEDSLRGGEPRIADARDGIERGLERAERGIADGRRDADAMLAQLGSRSAVSESERISKKFVADLVAAYHRAFDDEARIVDAMRGFLAALIAALEAPESEASVRLGAVAEEFDSEIAELVDARIAEQTRRLQLIEAFSAALAAAR